MRDIQAVTPDAQALKRTLDSWALFLLRVSVLPALFLAVSLLPEEQVQAAETVGANDTLTKSRVDEVMRSVGGMLGLSPKWPLDTRSITRDALRSMLTSYAEERIRDPDWAAAREALIIMGSWPDGYDATNPFLEVTVLNTAGIYSARRNALFVVSDPPRSVVEGPIRLDTAPPELENDIILAHEIVHALQHMHYPELFELDNPLWRHQNDAVFALRAAIEGEAVVISLQARLGYMGTLLPPDAYSEHLLGQARSPGFDPLERIPLLVREGQVYPYAYGYRLAWREGRKLLKSPPVSSEQAMHRKKRREPFLAIDLSRYREQLSQRGCELLYENTMGELSLSLLLRSYASPIPPEAWEGWDGDRYVTAKCNGGRAFAWLTSWDSTDDAIEFERAYRQIARFHRARANLSDDAATQRDDKRVLVLSSEFAKEKSTINSVARMRRVRTHAELAEFLEK